MPELVITQAETDTKSVLYTDIIAILTASIKEHENMLQKYTRRLTSDQKLVEFLRLKLARTDAHINRIILMTETQ